MGFTPEQIKDLSEKLDEGRVKDDRTIGGRKVDYIAAWDAIGTANRIFEFDGWSLETSVAFIREEEKDKKSGGGKVWWVSYSGHARVTVRANGIEIIREGSGCGHGIVSDRGEAHEGALKEAETDAMKRAFRTFGDQFGLELYDKDRRAKLEAEKQGAATREQDTAQHARELDNLIAWFVAVYGDDNTAKMQFIERSLAKFNDSLKPDIPFQAIDSLPTEAIVKMANFLADKHNKTQTAAGRQS